MSGVFYFEDYKIIYLNFVFLIIIQISKIFKPPMWEIYISKIKNLSLQCEKNISKILKIFIG